MSALPHGLPAKYADHWRRPWTDQARKSGGFRRWLHAHGYLTPHFTLADARCHDGTPIPRSLVAHARDHYFRMEKLRHALGDVPIPVMSGYRTDSYNRQIHGAKASRHVHADATDVDKSWVEKVGRQRVQHAAEVIFADGGVGTYPAGSMHFDSRGYRARWSSFVGW